MSNEVVIKAEVSVKEDVSTPLALRRTWLHTRFLFMINQ